MMNKTNSSRSLTRRSDDLLLQERSFLKDLLLTLGAAIWTGLAGSVLCILLVFSICGTV